MAHRDADPMSNLLSAVGGIDANLFKKPPALKDIAKSTTTVKPAAATQTKQPAQSARSVEPQTNALPVPSFAGRGPLPGAQQTNTQKPEVAQRAGSNNPGSRLDPFSSSQLDVLAGLGPAPKQSRAMRSSVPNSASSSVSEGLDALGKGVGTATPPAAAQPPATKVDQHLQDGLDALFTGQPAPAAKPEPMSQPASSGAAYAAHDLLGGLSSSAAPYAAPSPSHSQPSSALADDDFLVGFGTATSATPQPEDDFMSFGASHSKPAAAGADPFDMFPSPAGRTPEPQQPAPSYASNDLLGGFDGSLGMMNHARQAPQSAAASSSPSKQPTAAVPAPAQEVRPLRRSHSLQDSNALPVNIPVKRSPSGQKLDSPTQQTPSPPQLVRRKSGRSASGALGFDDLAPGSAPPAYDSVLRSSPASSTRSTATNRMSRNDMVDAQLGSGAASGQQRSRRQQSDEAVAGQGDSVWENPVHDSESSQPKWLSSGSKWLKSAGKKLHQAAQVGAEKLQSKLEEMDHRFANKGGHGRNRIGSQGEEADEIPAFYYEWAAKIQELPAERQSNTLCQMTEDDRLVVQRILDQNAISRGKQAGGSARRSSYEQSVESPPAPRPITRQSRTMSTEHDFDEPHSSADVHRQPSDGLQQGDGDASPHVSSSPQVPPPGRRQSFGAGTPSPMSDPHRRQPQPAAMPEPQPERTRQTPAAASTAKPAAAAEDLLGFSNSEAACVSPAAHTRAAPRAPAAAAPPPPDADFLGFTGAPTQPAGPSAAAASTAADAGADFLGFSGAPTHAAAPRTAAAAPDITDMFNAAPPSAPKAAAAAPAHDAFAQQPAQQRPAPAARPAAVPSRAPLSEKTPSMKAAAADMMMVFGEEGMDAAAAMASVSDVDVEGEPAERKAARQRRLREMQERMATQLMEKQMRDQEEAEIAAAKGDLRDQMQVKMDAWLAGKKDNIRALLSTLHTVLWEGSGWTPPGLTDLVEPARVKKSYMKANLIIHPDKVKQKGGTVEQIVVADMAFDALKTAWGRFEAELKRG